MSAWNSLAHKERELVLSRECWDRVLRMLLLDHHQVAMGPIRFHQTEHAIEALVPDLNVVTSSPMATASPVSDWALVCVRHEADASLDQELTRWQGHAAQRLVALQLDARQPGRWDGCVIDRQEKWPLNRVRVTGPSPLVLQLGDQIAGNLSAAFEPNVEAADAAHHSENSGAWSRLTGALGEAVMKRLHASEVTLIGASRGASQLALQLAQLGVPHLRLVDSDRVEPHNRDGMPVPPSAIGQPKVQALAQTLLSIHPELSVVCVDQPLQNPRALLSLQGRHDVVFSFVDTSVGHLAASELARHRLAIHIAVGSQVSRDEHGRRLAGDIRVFLPGPSGGCVGCVGGLPDPDGQLDYELARPPGTLRRGQSRNWQSDSRAGSLVTLNSLCAATAIQHWLDVLAGTCRSSVWTRIDWPANGSPEFQSSVVAASSDCGFCRP